MPFDAQPKEPNDLVPLNEALTRLIFVRTLLDDITRWAQGYRHAMHADPHGRYEPFSSHCLLGALEVAQYGNLAGADSCHVVDDNDLEVEILGQTIRDETGKPDYGCSFGSTIMRFNDDVPHGCSPTVQHRIVLEMLDKAIEVAKGKLEECQNFSNAERSYQLLPHQS